MTGDAAAGPQPRDDPPPQPVETLAGERVEDEAGVDEIGGGDLPLLEIGHFGPQTRPSFGRDAGAEPRERLRLPIDGEEAVAAAQDLETVAADAAAEIEGLDPRTALRVEPVEREQEGRPRRASGGDLPVAMPARGTIFG